jgi:hypothetical protein
MSLFLNYEKEGVGTKKNRGEFGDGIGTVRERYCLDFCNIEDLCGW